MIVFKPHSFIDVITNSSTELFVGEQARGIDFVKEALAEVLREYNEKNHEVWWFDYVFGRIETIDESNVDEFMDTMCDYLDSSDIISKNIEPYPQFPKYDYHATPADREMSWEKHDRDVAEWKNNNKAQFLSNCKGIIVVYGANDNSIPYEMYDAIEGVFGAVTRYHLG